MAPKPRTNSRADVTPTQAAWLNGEWLLGSAHASRSANETMEALSLIANVGGKSEALFAAHGNPETHFWRPGMDQPISISDLEHHEACWLESGEGDNDPYGAESYFIWKFYSDEERIELWETHGQKELYHWEPVLRRPIPKGASVDAAMVMFSDPLKPVRF
jgi:hypothetical protein